MDMTNDTKIHDCGFLPDLRHAKIKVGVRQIRKALSSGVVSRLILAQDADPALTEPLEKLAAEQNIQTTWTSSMSALGKACGIDVSAAAAAVVR